MGNTIYLSGGKYGLFDCKGCFICCAIADCKGEVHFDGLPCGKYYIRELNPPCGFMPCNKCVEVCVDGCDCKTVHFVSCPCNCSIRVVATPKKCCDHGGYEGEHSCEKRERVPHDCDCSHCD